MRAEGDAAAWRLANKVATLTMLVLGTLCALGMVFSHQLVALLAPGFDAQKAALTALLTRIMFPFILLVSLAALVMGMLNAKSVFGMPAMASSFFNVGIHRRRRRARCMIDPHFGSGALVGLAIGTLIGGGLQFAVQLPPLKRLGYRFRPDFHWRDRGVFAILALMGPSVIAASTTQVNVLINSMFASTLGDGAIFWLAIAFRLMQLPLGLFGVALGTVTLPLLSRLVVANQMTAFRSELARALRLMFLLTIPSTIGLMMLAEPIMSVLYQHGRFDAHQASQAGGALKFYAVGLAGYAALKVLGQRLLCARPAQDADGRELSRGRPESALQLDLHVSPGLGPPRTGVLDRMRRHLQLPVAVRADASAAGQSRVAAHARHALQDRHRRRCAGGRVLGLQPLAARRLGDAGVLEQDAWRYSARCSSAAWCSWAPRRCSGSTS